MNSHPKKYGNLYSIILVCALVFMPTCFLRAQATVVGKVTDANKMPIEDVLVSLLGLSQQPVYTNSNGEYKITVPSEKDVTLVFSNINFQQLRFTVNLKKGETINLDKSLAKNSNTLVDVVIEDKKSRSNGMVSLDPKVVTQIPSPTGDFNYILFSQMGVSNRNELSSQYSVRGGNFDENLVYVNDIEVYRPFLVRSGQQEGLSFVNADMVSSVLFSAGGFEAKYGDKMASVLDIKYRRPRKFAGTATAGVLGANVHVEDASKDMRLTWILGARYRVNRYLLGGLNTRADYQPRFVDVQNFITYDITEKWELNFLGNYSDNRYLMIPESRTTSFGTINQALQLSVDFDGQELSHFKSTTAALCLVNKPNDRLTLKYITSVFNTNENETFDVEGVYAIDELETDFGKKTFGEVKNNLGVGGFLNHGRNQLYGTVANVEHKGIYEKNKKQFFWGARYQFESFEDKLSEWKLIDSAGYSLPQLPLNTIDVQDVVKTTIILNNNRVLGYFQYSESKLLKDTSELSFTLGIRANYWDLNNQTVVSPRANISYKPNWKKDVLFRFSTGYYYQPPFYRELRDLYGKINPDLKAQQSIHFLLGTDINFKAWKRPFKFVTEAYYKDLKNLVPYEVDNVRIRYYAKNNAVGYVGGIDFKVNGEFIKGIESWATLSIMQTKENILDDYYYVYYNKNGERIVSGYTLDRTPADSIRKEPGYIPRPTDQRVSFSIFFQDYLPKLPDCKMHLNLLFGTPLPFGPPSFERYKDTLRMPPYRRVDIGFSYQIIKESKPLPKGHPFGYIKSLWVGAEVFNLLNVDNVVSYLWLKDIRNRQYAIPNYLTQRLINLRFIAKF
ncbi:MAG: TonB-dependent receptor [Bacteroidetes bacterium]|nr:TonB-dependent receptor [Bacteroidota bacterium]